MHGNSLLLNWEDVVPGDPNVMIVGNPPYSGALRLTDAQTLERKTVMGSLPNARGINAGRTDYVMMWIAKSAHYINRFGARAALVVTNSVGQGEQARALGALIENAGTRFKFVYQTHPWFSEAAGKAAVHVVILGIDDQRGATGSLYSFPHGKDSEPTETKVDHINEYLVEGPWIRLVKLKKPRWKTLSLMTVGSQATDYGHLTINSLEELDHVLEDPLAAKYVRPFMGADEMINGAQRWCLWLPDADPNDFRTSRVLRERLTAVKTRRDNSPTESFQKTPSWLFTHMKHPGTGYLAIPQLSSANRPYLPMRFFTESTIASNALMIIPNADLWLYGVLQSKAWMTWVELAAGRLKSDIRISPDIAYNSFPFPNPESNRESIIKTANDLNTTIEKHLTAGLTLATVCDWISMPVDVSKAHSALDSAVQVGYRWETKPLNPTDTGTRIVTEYRRISADEQL